MLTRLRTTGLAWAGTLLIVFVMTGVALGNAALTADQEPLDEDAPVAGAVAAFVDLDGNGVDDACQDEVVPDAEAAAAAEAAVDLDGDGTISVSEAARSDRTGGKNCNHGGYVSQVAKAACEAAGEDAEASEACEDEEEAEDDEEAAEKPPCEAVAAPAYDPELYSGPGGFGRYVSDVAQSDAVGGKNCNHGGAVSEAVRAAKEQAKAEREAAKAERRAEREAKKAEREAAKAERKAAKQGDD